MTISICDLPASEELTADEAAAVFGGAGAASRNRLRQIRRKIIRNNTVRLTRLKKGIYHVKYRAMATHRKQTSSRSSFSGANSFFG